MRTLNIIYKMRIEQSTLHTNIRGVAPILYCHKHSFAVRGPRATNKRSPNGRKERYEAEAIEREYGSRGGCHRGTRGGAEGEEGAVPLLPMGSSCHIILAVTHNSCCHIMLEGHLTYIILIM